MHALGAYNSEREIIVQWNNKTVLKKMVQIKCAIKYYFILQTIEVGKCGKDRKWSQPDGRSEDLFTSLGSRFQGLMTLA